MASHTIAHFHTLSAAGVIERYHLHHQRECDGAYDSTCGARVKLSRSALQHKTLCDILKTVNGPLVKVKVNGEHVIWFRHQEHSGYPLTQFILQALQYRPALLMFHELPFLLNSNVNGHMGHIRLMTSDHPNHFLAHSQILLTRVA